MMVSATDPILTFLQTCRELSTFCSQNGWIINESITYEVLAREQNQVLIYAIFLESIMEGSGCQGDQKPCYGRLQLILDETGKVLSAMIV